MNELYTCECQDGRTITGSSRWSHSELRRLAPLELAKVLGELADFARYYESVFYRPVLSLRKEIDCLTKRYSRAKRLAIGFGCVTGGLVGVWLVLVLLPSLRFSGLTLALAILTIASILVLIPLLFRFVSVQEDYSKRLPRARARLNRLTQKEEKEIYGEYVEYLIGAYLISPEFGLSADALTLMVDALRAKRASNLSEAILLCKNKFGRSPIPRIITSLHCVTAQGVRAKSRKNLDEFQNPPPDMQLILQLSGYLQTALQSYIAYQDSADSPLTQEEEALLKEYRSLDADGKEWVQSMIQSFRT